MIADEVTKSEYIRDRDNKSAATLIVHKVQFCQPTPIELNFEKYKDLNILIN